MPTRITPQKPPPKSKRKKSRWIAALILFLLAMAAFGAIFLIPHPRLFRVTVEPQQSEKVYLTSVNQVDVTEGQIAQFNYVSILHLEGIAPANTEIALTLCEGVTFRTTASAEDSTWVIDVPLIVLPKDQFSLLAQFQVDSQLGQPHRLADITIRNIDFLPRDWGLYAVSLLLVVLSMVVFWIPARQSK